MSIDDDIALLRSVPMLALLGREPLRILAIGAENRYVHEREVLFRAGDAADAGYVVQEGSFAIVQPGQDDAEPVIATAPTLLGELALIAEGRRSMTVTALEPSSVIRIPRPLFLKILEGYPELAFRLRDAVAQRATRMMAELTLVRRKLAAIEDRKSAEAAAAEVPPPAER
jgi:CRP-like cAMP-binding protein